MRRFVLPLLAAALILSGCQTGRIELSSGIAERAARMGFEPIDPSRIPAPATNMTATGAFLCRAERCGSNVFVTTARMQIAPTAIGITAEDAVRDQKAPLDQWAASFRTGVVGGVGGRGIVGPVRQQVDRRNAALIYDLNVGFLDGTTLHIRTVIVVRGNDSQAVAAYSLSQPATVRYAQASLLR